MKIVWVLGLAFLATGTAHSVPAEEQKTTNEQVEDGDKVEADNMALSEEEDEDSCKCALICCHSLCLTNNYFLL